MHRDCRTCERLNNPASVIVVALENRQSMGIDRKLDLIPMLRAGALIAISEKFRVILILSQYWAKTTSRLENLKIVIQQIRTHNLSRYSRVRGEWPNKPAFGTISILSFSPSGMASCRHQYFLLFVNDCNDLKQINRPQNMFHKVVCMIEPTNQKIAHMNARGIPKYTRTMTFGALIS
jgi:hypothetical protein